MIDPAAYYRMYAKIAVDMASEATDPKQRALLLELAQTWQDLADKEDQPDGKKSP